jgi:ribonuclease G
MYNVDDAVAKIDGYIISVTNGGSHVGAKRLVRIEEIGRTSATASLIGEENLPPAAPSHDDDGDDVQSKPRRRGRRGGRRRSAAKAESAGE